MRTMKVTFDELLLRVKSHPTWFAVASAVGLGLTGTITDLVKSGAQSYAAAIGRAIVLGWHPVPFLLGCIGGSGGTMAWVRYRERPGMPDDSQEVRWVITWKRNRVVTLKPVCPNPNCRGPIKLAPQSGQRDLYTVLWCELCGFSVLSEDTPAVILANAVRDLEGQASGHAPLPPKRPRASWGS
jgi:hypothetical protein